MGSCISNNSEQLRSSSSAPVYPIENQVFQRVLATIPNQFRQEIANLPAREFLDAYEYHAIAVLNYQRKDYDLARLIETLAISKLEILLPQNKDHWIFMELYKILATCAILSAHVPTAIHAHQSVLHILMKYTPTDYVVIAEEYYKLSIIYKVFKDYRGSIDYLTRAIESAQSSEQADAEWIRTMEAKRQALIQKDASNGAIRANQAVY
ncbi:unnamed protein product [Adineta ricciae]|uniref:Uncharacterized protein n=1 Tax=Adineta ricciae TaxID=249248 RepID=A0A815J0S5_ADIRI|nr:unnamed protein product [Adineta ricciae]CAF1372915.1 unnamed protein product [Adineta ricciae]